jgi:rfaE bifunctional protein kinase chain/domain
MAQTNKIRRGTPKRPGISSAFIPRPSSLGRARVLVVGDVMLDRYWIGDASRISPEAPVPVVLFQEEKASAGGAANVARNCAALSVRTRLLSVVGDDDEGTLLAAMLKKDGVRASLHKDGSVRTIQKLRVIGRGQQLLRIDFETAPSREVLASKLAEFKAALPACDAVILSDYGKGGLAHIKAMIGAARAAGKKVLVDPKGDDYSRYRGAHVITPNLAELREVVGSWTGEADLARRAQRLRASLRLEALLLTRGADGMTLYRRPGALRIPAEKREVYDVTGAGDTVIAVLGALLAAGASLESAVRLANRAGGIVVGKFGTAVVTPDELFGSDSDE